MLCSALTMNERNPMVPPRLQALKPDSLDARNKDEVPYAAPATLFDPVKGLAVFSHVLFPSYVACVIISEADTMYDTYRGS